MNVYTDTKTGITVRLRAAYCGDFVVAQVCHKGCVMEETAAYADPEKAIAEAKRLIKALEIVEDN